MCIPRNSAMKVVFWRSSRAGIALPPESGSTTMYCLIGSTKRSFHRESAPPASSAASGSRRATSALSTRSTSSLEVDTRPGERVIARGSVELIADFSGESTTADERHLGRHDGHELHVGIERQVTHLQHRPADESHVTQRLRLDL